MAVNDIFPGRMVQKDGDNGASLHNRFLASTKRADQDCWEFETSDLDLTNCIYEFLSEYHNFLALSCPPKF